MLPYPRYLGTCTPCYLTVFPAIRVEFFPEDFPVEELLADFRRTLSDGAYGIYGYEEVDLEGFDVDLLLSLRSVQSDFEPDDDESAHWFTITI